MTDCPIPASAIEAAAKTFPEYGNHAERYQAEAALRAAFDELGMEFVVEERRSEACLAYEPRQYHGQWRSRWMPVEDESVGESVPIPPPSGLPLVGGGGIVRRRKVGRRRFKEHLIRALLALAIDIDPEMAQSAFEWMVKP